MIVIVDYGMGNLGSIQNMLRRLGQDSTVTAEKEIIARASKLILPGVGAFDTGMQRLNDLQLVTLLNEKALVERVPVLGICLGMQLITNSSEEGALPGLGWIPARTLKFQVNEFDLRTPHMGWNEVEPSNDHHLFKVPPGQSSFRYYFVHTYFVECEDHANVIGWTNYGNRFASAIASGNVMGTQFHPEKSHKFGMALLKSFSDM